MTEKRFLGFILTEGILLTALGIVMLMIPKVTTATFGVIMSIVFIIYGGFKVINSIISRNYTRHFLYNLILGLFLIATGILLLNAPYLSLVLLTSFIAVYFILESISTWAFSVQNRRFLSFWWAGIFVAIMQFFLGLIILLGLPQTALWVAGMLAGINFLITGVVMIGTYLATKSAYYIENKESAYDR